MAKHKIRQRLSAWALVYYILVEMIFIYLSHLRFQGKVYGPLMGALAFLIILLLQQFLHRRSFRQGIKYLKKNQYEAAITCFQKSLKHFEQYPFLDKYRYVLLISPSEISCRELALQNILACYCFLNNTEKATFYYDSLIRINDDWEVRMPLLDQLLNGKL